MTQINNVYLFLFLFYLYFIKNVSTDFTLIVFNFFFHPFLVSCIPTSLPWVTTCPFKDCCSASWWGHNGLGQSQAPLRVPSYKHFIDKVVPRDGSVSLSSHPPEEASAATHRGNPLLSLYAFKYLLVLLKHTVVHLYPFIKPFYLFYIF